MNGFSLSRRGILGTLLLVGVLVAGVAVSRVSATPQPTSTPEPVSAVEACHLPDTAEKADGTLGFRWQLAVRVDSPQVSILFFTSGSDSLLCEAWRGTDGNYGSSTTTAIGRFAPQHGAELTYDSGTRPVIGNSWPSQLVLGQTPRSVTSIEVVTADGELHDATIGSGFYLAWVSAGNQPSEVVEIVARDSAGTVIARLADPSGLQPGASAAPASS